MKFEDTKYNICCPTCHKQDTWSKENQFKPFCSDRCKLIDLGEWANESRQIASQPSDELVDFTEVINH